MPDTLDVQIERPDQTPTPEAEKTDSDFSEGFKDTAPDEPQVTVSEEAPATDSPKRRGRRPKAEPSDASASPAEPSAERQGEPAPRWEVAEPQKQDAQTPAPAAQAPAEDTEPKTEDEVQLVTEMEGIGNQVLQRAYAEQQQYQQAIQARQQQIQQQQPPQPPPAPAPQVLQPQQVLDQLPDEIKTLYEDYPAVRQALEYEVQKVRAQAQQAIQQQEQQYVSVFKQVVQKEQEIENRQRTIEFNVELAKVAPDAYTLIAQPEFREWYKAQKPEIQAVMAHPDPREASKIFTYYKIKQAQTKVNEFDQNTQTKVKNIQRQLSVAPTSNRRPGSSSAGKDDFSAGFYEEVG
jgi:hypothetical protein